MKFQIIPVLWLVVIFSDTVFGNDDDFCEIDKIHPEAQCNGYGGMCVIASDCPSGSLVERSGLCPQQQSKGVECCYNRSVKDTRCKNLGDCISVSSFCSPSLIYPATDCPKNTKCCILV